jgi:hypothetical protein
MVIATLGGLLANTVYHYQVISRDAAGNVIGRRVLDEENDDAATLALKVFARSTHLITPSFFMRSIDLAYSNRSTYPWNPPGSKHTPWRAKPMLTAQWLTAHQVGYSPLT